MESVSMLNEKPLASLPLSSPNRWFFHDRFILTSYSLHLFLPDRRVLLQAIVSLFFMLVQPLLSAFIAWISTGEDIAQALNVESTLGGDHRQSEGEESGENNACKQKETENLDEGMQTFFLHLFLESGFQFMEVMLSIRELVALQSHPKCQHSQVLSTLANNIQTPALSSPTQSHHASSTHTHSVSIYQRS